MISIHNNTTKYKTLTPKHLLDDCKHLLLPYLHNNIVSIDIRDNNVEIMREDCSIAKININENLKCSGTIKWFDESSGDVVIRLENGKSAHFFSCNVEGADSLYPELVTNIKFDKGQAVDFEIPADAYIFRALGFINIKGAK